MDKGHSDRVSKKAYELWQKEGSPHGRDQEFWERAEAMLKDDHKPPVTTPLQQRTKAEKKVDEAMKASFPASDPPAFTATTGTGKKSKTPSTPPTPPPAKKPPSKKK